MSNVRPLRPVDEHPSGMSTAEAIAAYLQWLGGHRGRSGRLTSPQTLRAYTSALPRAFAGYDTLAELAEDSGHRLRTNLRTAWGDKSPATWNARDRKSVVEGKRADVHSGRSNNQRTGYKRRL